MKKKKSVSRFLKGLLDFVFGMMLLVPPLVLIKLWYAGETLLVWPNLAIGGVILILVLLILYQLRQLVKSVSDKDPFREQNVRRFKLIGFAIFAIGVVDLIINFRSLEGFVLIGIASYGGIKASVLLYLVLGYLAMIMAEVFEAAIEIKDENDLTV